MSRERLNLLFVSMFPPSPATFGAQRRIEGLMKALSRRHHVTGLSLISPEYDAREAERAMRSYCEDVVLVPSRSAHGLSRRMVQLRSLVSRASFEHLFNLVPALQPAIDDLLLRRPYDAISLHSYYVADCRFRQAPPGAPVPRLTVDEHNIEHDLRRQSRDASRGLVRRLFHSVNWGKALREGVGAWRGCDGVTFTSADDEARARALLPSIRSAVIPNAADLEYFRPRPDLPPSDARTALFFGTLNYFPNEDGVRHLLQDIWPLLERSHPRARLKVIGADPTPEVLSHRGPRVEVAGLVDDLRPHLSEAAVTVVPLRVGGGTRFKILEAMAMGKPVVSTTIGAEGIVATPGRDILLADDPGAFAAAVGRVLDDPDLARRLGAAGRALVEKHYSWTAVAGDLERFFRDLIDEPRPACAEPA